MMNLKKLEEAAHARGKTLLIEKVVFSVTKDNVEVVKETGGILIESNGQKLLCRGILRNVPVSRFIENANGRIYPRRLWEKIITEGVAEGTLSLADHPGENEEGSILNICGVWRNPRISEDTVRADWYLVGDVGQLIMETVSVGGKVGTSSVGFGEFEEDNKTVQWDSYELVRLADAVIDPSQMVYATKENIETPKSEYALIQAEKVNKKINNYQNLSEQGNTNKARKAEESAMDNITLFNISNRVKRQLKEAAKNPNLIEAQKDVRDLVQEMSKIPELSDLKEAANHTLHDITARLESQINSQNGTIKQVSESITSMTEKYNTSVALIKKMKAKMNEKSKKHSSFVSEAKKVIDQLILNQESMAKDIMQLLSDRKRMMADMASFAEDKKMLMSDLKHALTERKGMVADIKQLVADKKLAESDVKRLVKDRRIAESDVKRLMGILKENNVTLQEEDENAMGELGDYAVKGDSQGAGEMAYPEVTDKGDENFATDPAIEYMSPRKPATMERRQPSITGRRPITEQRAVTSSAVKQYFEEAVAKNPAIRDIKQEILSSGSLMEAVKKVETFTKGNGDERPIRLSESKRLMEEAKKDEWLGERM